MDFKIVFRETFLTDLEGILKVIARSNPEAARKLGLLIVQAGESLSFFPERHPRLRERSGIRRLVVKKYFKIFYRIDYKLGHVEILRCWDGRRGVAPRIQM